MYVHSFNYLLNKLELGGYTYLQLKKKKLIGLFRLVCIVMTGKLYLALIICNL